MRTVQILVVLLLINFVSSWVFPTFEQTNSTSLSIVKDLNQMMSMMQQRFQRLFRNLPTFSMNTNWEIDRKELDSIEPNCTTTKSNSSSRRKKLRSITTTICTKEFIANGQKQFYKETNVTDDQGNLLSRSKIYQTMFHNLTSDDRNIISY